MIPETALETFQSAGAAVRFSPLLEKKSYIHTHIHYITICTCINNKISYFFLFTYIHTYIPLVFGEKVEDVVFFRGGLGLHGHLDRAGLVIAGRKPAIVCMYVCMYVCM